MLEGKAPKTAGPGQGRKIGTNIMRYMMMFLLMQGTLYARLLLKTKKSI